MTRQHFFRPRSRTARCEPLEGRTLLSSVPTSFGAVGDSLTAGNTLTVSWVPDMVVNRSANFGGASAPYNVAIGGTTTSTIFSTGEVSSMQSLVGSGQVQLPYLFIGGNDLRGVATQIANGTLTGAALTTTINGWISNITTATDNIRTSFPAGVDKDFVLVSFPDTTANPEGQSIYNTPAKLALGHAAINQANAALFAAADARGIPVVDLIGLQNAVAGGPLVVGGVTINTTTANADPHYFYRDIVHPGAIGHSIIANLMMAASNVGYGTSFAMLSDAEMLTDAGLAGSYTGETLSPLVDYTQFIHFHPITASSVAGTSLFYKGSTAWDVTNNNLPGFSDDNAIAADKTAYLPGGGAATFSAVSSYTRGINGLMVDLAGSHGTLTANDFIFKIGNNNSPSTWATATGPTLVTTRAGAGAGGSDRVELIWADNAIQKTWLEVIVKGYDTLGGSNTNTGLANSYAFFFCNALADSGSGDGGAFVTNSIDEQSARSDPHSNVNKATIANVNDFDRNALVNSVDQQFTRASNSNSNATAPKFINIAAGGPFAPASESRGVAASVDAPASLEYNDSPTTSAALEVDPAGLMFGLTVGWQSSVSLVGTGGWMAGLGVAAVPREAASEAETTHASITDQVHDQATLGDFAAAAESSEIGNDLLLEWLAG
jgi:hypothetical protein